MEVTERNEKQLVFSSPLTQEKAIAEMTGESDELWWKDLYVEPDVVENDSRVIYIVDTRTMCLYWGYVGNKVFDREPDLDSEQEILQELGFIGEEVNNGRNRL